MLKFAKAAFIGTAAAALFAHSAVAADVIEAPVMEAPAPAPVVIEEAAPAPVHGGSGWYLRGDIGYVVNGELEGEYATPGGTNVIYGELDNGFSAGGGIGYQMTDHLRADLTVDYFSASDFVGSTRGACGVALDCISTDISSYSALSVMANAYVDLGTHGRFTPYVGAGIGGTYVKWDDLSNTACDATNPVNCDPTVIHGGGKGWRATAALMAGASIDVTCNLKADIGYRFRHIEGGRMFEFASGNGPGDHDSLQTHEVRAGLRYALGGHGCGGKAVAYHDAAPVDYNPPVYK